MLLAGILIALIGVALAVFWRRDAGLVLAIVGAVLALASLITGANATL